MTNDNLRAVDEAEQMIADNYDKLSAIRRYKTSGFGISQPTTESMTFLQKFQRPDQSRSSWKTSRRSFS